MLKRILPLWVIALVFAAAPAAAGPAPYSTEEDLLLRGRGLLAQNDWDPYGDEEYGDEEYYGDDEYYGDEDYYDDGYDDGSGDYDSDFDRGIYGGELPARTSPMQVGGSLNILYERSENTELGFGLDGFVRYDLSDYLAVEGGLGFQSMSFTDDENSQAKQDALSAGYSAPFSASGGDAATIIPLTVGLFGQVPTSFGRLYAGFGFGYYMTSYDITITASDPALANQQVSIKQSTGSDLGHFWAAGLQYRMGPNTDFVAELRYKILRPSLSTTGDTRGFSNIRTSLFLDSFDYRFGIAYAW